MDNKVSEKAIWEGSITPDNDTSSFVSQLQTQPQMMFCYKCNNVIPANSKFCPCCNIELYTTCPKCGIQYSSQYSVCNQCGTNRQEYLQLQRKEQERIEARKREERLQREKLEREKQEKERQEKLKQYAQQETERQQKEAYLAENAQIKKTREYESAYSLIDEAWSAFDKKCRQRTVYTIIIGVVGYILVAYAVYNNMVAEPEPLIFGFVILAPLMCGTFLKYLKSATALIR